MKTKTIILYTYDELPDDAKDKAIEKLWDLNISHAWYEYTYDDAAAIGLKIADFDLNSISAKGFLTATAEEAAYAIIKSHGETCDTFKLASEFLKQSEELKKEHPEDDEGDRGSEYDDAKEAMEAGFERALIDEYAFILNREYEYLTSRPVIEESIRANEYHFDEAGNLS